eukprot:1854114-Rhodomonas_salina.1
MSLTTCWIITEAHTYSCPSLIAFSNISSPPGYPRWEWELLYCRKKIDWMWGQWWLGPGTGLDSAAPGWRAGGTAGNSQEGGATQIDCRSQAVGGLGQWAWVADCG